jgi:hypothetical protein
MWDGTLIYKQAREDNGNKQTVLINGITLVLTVLYETLSHFSGYFGLPQSTTSSGTI